MRIAILGGGPAGLSAAIGLKLLGMEATVYERRPRPGSIGAGIVCWPNASFVLRELGVRAALRARAGRPTRMVRLTRSGEPLGALDIRLLDGLMGHPSLAVLREALQGALLQRLAELGGSIRYGRQVVALEEAGARSVRIRFADGAAHTADVVLGADGRMRSVARGFVLGSARPVYQGFLNWIGVFESSSDRFDELAIRDFWGVGDRFGIVPVSRRRAYWAAALASPRPVPSGPCEDRPGLLERFGAWPEPVRALIEGTPAARIRRIAVHDHDPAERWHRGRVLLIGDAAHAALPTSGQGACQALEDAWHLMQAFGEHSAPEAAFAAFQERRIGKCRGITQGGRRLARALFASSPDACQARDQQARETDYDGMARGMARGWAAGLPLTTGEIRA